MDLHLEPKLWILHNKCGPLCEINLLDIRETQYKLLQTRYSRSLCVECQAALKLWF